MDQIKDFYYEGYLSASKSLMNRALIAQSFFPSLDIIGDSLCEDVRLLKAALFKFNHGFNEAYDCGSGGTTFRFLLARLSREEGQFSLIGTHRLLERPHRPLYDLLKGLSVEIEMEEKNCIRLRSQGWNWKGPLKTDLSQSSQFCSALLLSAWNLPETLRIDAENFSENSSYLNMTIEFLKKMGMEVNVDGIRVEVPAGQKMMTEALKIEPDMSSLFTLACFAATNGRLKLFDFPSQSIQPDYYFLEIFEKMGIPFEINEDVLSIKSAQGFRPLDLSLKGNPDLFPVLSVFLSRVEGESTLGGLDVLAFKESDRLQNTMDLLGALGVKYSFQNKKLRIQGRKNHSYPQSFTFDPDQDHRMAMAAALAVHQGAKIDIQSKEVVDKSFPEFWGVVR